MGRPPDTMGDDDAHINTRSLTDLGLAFGDLNRRISEHLDWLHRATENGTPPLEDPPLEDPPANTVEPDQPSVARAADTASSC